MHSRNELSDGVSIFVKSEIIKGMGSLEKPSADWMNFCACLNKVHKSGMKLIILFVC